MSSIVKSYDVEINNYYIILRSFLVLFFIFSFTMKTSCNVY